MNLINDFINIFYIHFNQVFDSNIRSKVSFLDEKVKDFFQELDLQGVGEVEKRQIKASIIWEFKQQPELIVPESLTNRLSTALHRTQEKLSLSMLPDKPIPLTKSSNLASQKVDYIRLFTKSFTSEDQDIIDYMHQQELQEVAELIDDAMRRNPTFREFAALIAIESRRKISSCLFKMGKPIDAASLRRAALAIFLLQKNDCFVGAIRELIAECKEDKLDFVKVNAQYFDQGSPFQ